VGPTKLVDCSKNDRPAIYMNAGSNCKCPAVFAKAKSIYQ